MLEKRRVDLGDNLGYHKTLDGFFDALECPPTAADKERK
jgi:hypothetical protein